MSGANPLQMKLFRAFGGEEQLRLQHHINTWLADAHTRGLEIVKTETALCSIGASEEIYQNTLVVVWYRRATENGATPS